MLETVNQSLIDHVLLNITSEYPKDVAEKLALLRREKVLKPVIYIGAGTCGMVAGAGSTSKAVENYLIEKSMAADIIQVGCIGLCSAEPILDIQMPGKNRISFENITADKVDAVLDGVFNYSIPGEYVLGQFRNSNLEAWDGVNYIDELPFFASQKRIVLKIVDISILYLSRSILPEVATGHL